MALTTAQLNAHLRAMIQNELATITVAEIREGGQEAGFLYGLLRACVRHVRIGDADSIEAGKTVAVNVLESILGRPATAGELHQLRRHWAKEADDSVTTELD